MSFKKGFLWGGSVSCMQTEGAYDEGGKGLSFYDIQPVKEDNSDWKTAIDTYHRYREDFDLFKEMGFNCYRFSLSWSRIFPDGEGQPNEEGLKFYDDFIDALIERGIEPFICLYHFDLPVAIMKKYGGWSNRKTLDAFNNYTRTVIDRYGDRVKYWIAFNEQNVLTLIEAVHENAYKKLNCRQLQSNIRHHTHMASAYMADYLHEHCRNALAGGMINYMPAYPASCDSEDVMAAYKLNRAYNNQTLDVFSHGRYPADLWNYWERNGLIPQMQENDLEYLARSRFDFLAHSYYVSILATKQMAEEASVADELLLQMLKGKIKFNDGLEKTAWGTAIDPWGIRYAVTEMYHRYNMPVFTIECGIGVEEEADENGYVDDDYRISYLNDHIAELKKAVEIDGVDLMGFLTWGPIDILSSTGEMRKRYGFIYVNRTDTDLRDLKRSRKKSFEWFREVISANGENVK